MISSRRGRSDTSGWKRVGRQREPLSLLVCPVLSISRLPARFNRNQQRFSASSMKVYEHRLCGRDILMVVGELVCIAHVLLDLILNSFAITPRACPWGDEIRVIVLHPLKL